MRAKLSFARAYVFADHHFIAEQPSSITNFCRIVDSLNPQESVIILLGDLFQLWSSYEYEFDQGSAMIFSALSRFRHSGGRVIFVFGNKDIHFYPKAQDAKKIKSEEEFDIIAESISLDVAGKSVHFEHGDRIDLSDKKYLLFRKLHRSFILRGIFNLLPRSIALALIERLKLLFSSNNKKYTLPLAQILAWSSSLEEKTELCIIGHFHPQANLAFNYQSKKIIIMAPWFNKPQYILLDNAGLSVLQS